MPLAGNLNWLCCGRRGSDERHSTVTVCAPSGDESTCMGWWEGGGWRKGASIIHFHKICYSYDKDPLEQQLTGTFLIFSYFRGTTTRYSTPFLLLGRITCGLQKFPLSTSIPEPDLVRPNLQKLSKTKTSWI